jgi:hypothetical protein
VVVRLTMLPRGPRRGDGRAHRRAKSLKLQEIRRSVVRLFFSDLKIAWFQGTRALSSALAWQNAVFALNRRMERAVTPSAVKSAEVCARQAVEVMEAHGAMNQQGEAGVWVQQ